MNTAWFAKRNPAAILKRMTANSDPGMNKVALVAGAEIAAYGFGSGHPFGPDRHDVFLAELENSSAVPALQRHKPRRASREELLAFHTPNYVDRVERLSLAGQRFSGCRRYPRLSRCLQGCKLRRRRRAYRIGGDHDRRRAAGLRAHRGAASRGVVTTRQDSVSLMTAGW